MREGVLSDESILKQCREYRPIPLGLTQQILEIQKPADYKPVLQVRKPKYLQHAPTPATFNVMSSAVAKSMDPINPAPIRQQLNAQYDKEVIDLLKEEQEPATPKQEPAKPKRNRTVDEMNKEEVLMDSSNAARVLLSPNRLNTRARAYERTNLPPAFEQMPEDSEEEEDEAE